MQHIWSWYCNLADKRGGGFGPGPLTHQEVRAWRLEMQIVPRPTPWEIEQLMMIDRIDRRVQYEKSKDKDKPGKQGR